MKKLSLTFKSIFAIFLVAFVCLIPVACSCDEMDGEIVYNNYVEFINKENDIFKFNDDKIVVIEINYAEDIEKALIAEKDAYLNPTDTSKEMYPFSDFYIIKAIYEPMLEKSISQIGSSYLLLKNQKDQLNKEKCNLINENLKAVESSSIDLNSKLGTLNNNAVEFKKEDGAYAYRNPQSTLYNDLKNLKKSYENLIKDCFVLNNNFMDLYMDTLGDYSFADIKAEDFTNVEKNGSILPVVDNYLNYMVSMLSYVSFMIDGNNCSFLTSNNPFYELYHDQEPNAFASRYLYDEHYSQIDHINLFNLASKSDAMQANFLETMKLCQSRFAVLKQQIGYFNEAISKVNYKNYVIYCNSHESAKTNYLEYALTLDVESKNHFITVKEFLDNYFTPLASSLTLLQTQIYA